MKNENVVMYAMLFVLHVKYVVVDYTATFYIVDERFVYPIIDRFSLQLISPVSWEIIPSTR